MLSEAKPTFGTPVAPFSSNVKVLLHATAAVFLYVFGLSEKHGLPSENSIHTFLTGVLVVFIPDSIWSLLGLRYSQ